MAGAEAACALVLAFSLPALMDASEEGRLSVAQAARDILAGVSPSRSGQHGGGLRPEGPGDAAPAADGVAETGRPLGSAEAASPNVPDGYAARCAALGERFGLSPRETEIMGYLVRGRDLPFIRDALYISRNTINTHVRHIYGKMGIHSKQELIDLFEQPDPPREG